MSDIHPTAIIHPGAQLGEGVAVGPYCTVGDGVSLGDGCILHSHVAINGPSRIGRHNEFFPFACVGQRTQDLKYAGEPTYLEIGDHNRFREFVTVHRATATGGATRIGDGCNFLAYSHIAHDCTVGNRVILSNNGTLGGHVTVEDHAIVSGLTAVHQFCRIGKHAITGGCSKIVQDIPPFMVADGNPAAVRSINKVGLERAGFPEKTIRTIRSAFKILYRSDLNLQQALDQIRSELPESPEIAHLVEFIGRSERGIIR